MLGYSLHSVLRGISSPCIKPPPPSPSTSSSAVPTSLAASLQSGDLDACLDLISSILIEDLFGTPAEERESGENVAKIPDSKTPQSYNCYEILAQFLSPQLIPDLLTPIREVSHCCYSYAHMYMYICTSTNLKGIKTCDAVLQFGCCQRTHVMNRARVEGSIHTCTPHTHVHVER